MIVALDWQSKARELSLNINRLSLLKPKTLLSKTQLKCRIRSLLMQPKWVIEPGTSGSEPLCTWLCHNGWCTRAHY